MSKRSIVHVEIPVTDPESSMDFYREMFDWELEHMGAPYHYTTGETGNTGIGLPQLGEMYKPGDVVIYVESENIEGDLEKAESLGAKKMGEILDIPQMGRMAFFMDPSGNRLAFWQNTRQM